MKAFTDFHDHNAAATGQGWTMITASRDTTPDDRLDGFMATELDVAVQRVPWKLRADLITARGHEARADVLVVDGATFWSRTGSETTTNSGDPHHTHGGGDITHLLDPRTVPQLFDLTVTGYTSVAGRPCTAVSATRRPASAGGWPMRPRPPFAMISGGIRFQLSVDTELGILLRVVKVVDDLDAEVTEFTDITIDKPIPDHVFAPLPDARAWPS